MGDVNCYDFRFKIDPLPSTQQKAKRLKRLIIQAKLSEPIEVLNSFAADLDVAFDWTFAYQGINDFCASASKCTAYASSASGCCNGYQDARNLQLAAKIFAAMGTFCWFLVAFETHSFSWFYRQCKGGHRAALVMRLVQQQQPDLEPQQYKAALLWQCLGTCMSLI